ncbi:MAG: hypothetical protein JWQ76_5124 [Ramlibacter sp.]|nr:hypothetical protein [Ramlibacter sp.]
MTGRKRLLLALNLVPLSISFYLVRHFYGAQLDFDLLSWKNLLYFLALVALSVIGYSNTIWRYIMALKREGATVDERSISERLMYINLISFFLPFGVLNYAAQLALVYRQNPARLVGRAFLHDKLVFLGAIAFCFLFTFGHLTPYLSSALRIPPGLVQLGMAGSVLGVALLCGYLALRHYVRFFLAQLAVFALLNAAIAALLVAYADLGGLGAVVAYLEKLFAYSAAIVLPVSLGGVGPREAILLYDVGDPALRSAVLTFCVLWFFALIAAAVLLFLLKKQASDFAVRQYLRWRVAPAATGAAGTIQPKSERQGSKQS